MQVQTSNTNLPILILGGGFTGLFTALYLRHLQCSCPVILVDQSWRFVFKPLLYELLSSEINLELVLPRYDELLHKSGITFLLDTVQAIDLQQRQVRFNSGLSYNYRYLVLALGSTTGYFGTPGAKEYSLPFRTDQDVFALGKHLRSCLQRASQTEDPEQRRKLLTIAIIGAGPAGVELAATLADLLPTWYTPFGGNAQDIRIVILQRGTEILKDAVNERLRKTAHSALSRRTAHVELLLGAGVRGVQPDAVEFEQNGQTHVLETATIVWTAGTATHPLIEALPIAAEHRDKRGRLIVHSTLQLPDFPEVFAGGDCSIDPQNPQPATAQVAYQQGRAIAHNIKALLEGKQPLPAQVHLRGTLLKLGLDESAAEIFDRFEVKGKLGHLIRQGAYLELLPTPGRNFVAGTEWLTEEMFRQIAG
ncbi:NADH dehydrogenase [Scytonema sp. HK-05]|uniref:NAD(P)/FAD-dependent oxidoreductase n=1 Tax=Scytonema sp. HK-05 TaxID=1137095 RepID=UPI0009373F52|nr:NAD(P)/FAD-dependent oxidoreductase [Scytonema sp. HK-05]OKH54008.1 NADH dehydrogenase [Scytonema sp. HK-05]BAY49847.1 NADH dehydrogenase [Scytonema sp. HK-05]